MTTGAKPSDGCLKLQSAAWSYAVAVGKVIRGKTVSGTRPYRVSTRVSKSVEATSRMLSLTE